MAKEGQIIKKITIVLITFAICLLFAGCKGSFLSPIDDLISPVSPSGDDAGILAAVDIYCKGDFSVKIPSKGNYTTSFIRNDIDGDGNDEAFAFYVPDESLGTVNMAVLAKKDNQWRVVSNIVGEGADVNSVEFSDINDDGVNEIILCWKLISKSSTSNLCIYDIDEELEPVLVANSISASDFLCVDINDDNVNELLIFTIGSKSQSPKAELYSFKDNSRRYLGETKLDSTILSISSIICGETDEGRGVYVDAVRSDGNSMVTELLHWSDYYNSIVSPYYSYSTARTKDTTRNNTIVCRDIDGDDKIEIPLDKSISGLPSQLSYQNWVSYGNTVLNHKAYSLACKRDSFLIVLDDDVVSTAKFSYDEEKRELIATDGKTDIFRVMTVIKSNYNSDDYSEYTEILSDSGYVYLARVNDESDVDITVDELKNAIKPY